MPIEPEGLPGFRGRIDESVYCGTCGYNLRTLPWIGRCPECGSHYNARWKTRHGIFLPQELRFPLGDVFTTTVCAATTGFLALRIAVTHPFPWALGVLCLLLAIATLQALLSTCESVGRYMRFRSVGRDDRDDDDRLRP